MQHPNCKTVHSEIVTGPKGKIIKVAAAAKQSRQVGNPQLGNPVVVLVSADDILSGVVNSALEAPWRLERHYYLGEHIDFINIAEVRLVVVDDEFVSESERGWLLAQIRRDLERASLLYVTADHSAENERRARTNGAYYYTSKPVMKGELTNVLKAFMKATARSAIC